MRWTTLFAILKNYIDSAAFGGSSGGITPQQLQDALETKLDKVTTGDKAQIYAVDSGNDQNMLTVVANSAAPNSIPERNANGNFVIGSPTADGEAANKSYVDQSLNTLFVQRCQIPLNRTIGGSTSIPRASLDYPDALFAYRKSLITDAFGTLAVYIDEDVNAGTINVMTKTISPSFMQDTSGVIPPNVMTTDTDQTITGTKDFDTILASLIEFGIGSGKYIENVSGSVSAYLDYLLLYNDLTVNGTSKLQGIVTLEGKAFQDWLNQKADIKDIDWATIPANIALPRGRNWRIEIREPGIIQDHNYLRYFYPDTQTAQQDDPVNAVARWIIDDGTGTGMLGKAMRIEYLESGVITDVLNITNSNGVSWTGEYPFIVRPITEISTLWYFGDIKQDPFPTDEPNISSIVEMGIEGVLTFIGDVNNLRTQNKQIVPAINELYGTITGDILAGHIYCFDTEVETHMTWFDSRKIFKRSIQWSGSLSSSTGGTNIGTAANLLGDTNATVVNPPAEIFNATTGASGGAQCMVSGGNLFVAVNNSISGGGDWYITLYYVKGQ